MRKILIIAGIASFMTPNAATAQSADIARCNASPKNAEQIRACSNLLPLPFNPRNMAAVHYQRALGYKELGQLDDVIYDTTRAIELLSGYQKKSGNLAVVRRAAYELRGEVYKTKGLTNLSKADWEQALSLASQAIEESPDADSFNGRAWIYHLMDEDAKGLPDVMKSLNLDPKSATAIETRAEIYEKLGRRDDAVADYRASLSIAPALQSSKDGLARLGEKP